MTNILPTVSPAVIPDNILNYRAVTDIVPFTYRSGMTYQKLLEEIRLYATEYLPDYLVENFGDMQSSWQTNLDALHAAVDAALATQATSVNDALTAEQANVNTQLQGAIDALAAGSITITDPAVLAVLEAASSATRDWLDARYGEGALTDAHLYTTINPTDASGDPHTVRDWLDTRYLLETKYGHDYLIVNNLPGFLADGSADMTTIINNAILSIADGSYTNLVVLPSAFGRTTIRIDSTLVLDTSRALLVAPFGGVQIDATHVTTTAIRVTATTAVPNNSGVGGPELGPFRLIGPGRNVAGVTGILFSADASTGQVRHIATRNMELEEFSVGIQYGDNAYCVSHYNLNIKGCDTGESYPLATNGGEAIRHFGGTTQDCRNAISLVNANADVYYSGGYSFDYFTGSVVVLSGGTLSFTDCHIEASILTTTYWFQFHGGNFTMRGGMCLGSGTYSSVNNPGSWVYNDSPSSAGLLALFDTVLFHNMVPSSGFFAAGTGNTQLRRSRNFGGASSSFQHSAAVDNCMVQGDFESSVIFDEIYLASDTSAILDTNNTSTTITGANITATPSADIKKSGTYSLKVNKVNGSGSNAAIEIAVPITPGQLAGFSGYLARHATLSGTVNFYTYFARMLPKAVSATKTQKGKNVSYGSRSFSTTTDLAAVDTWYPIAGVTALQRAPMWATHLIIQVNLNSMGPGAIYLDEFMVTSF